MPMSDAKRRANRKWNAENMTKMYDRIGLLVPKGRSATIKAYAKSHGYKSVNEYINHLLMVSTGVDPAEWKPNKE